MSQYKEVNQKVLEIAFNNETIEVEEYITQLRVLQDLLIFLTVPKEIKTQIFKDLNDVAIKVFNEGVKNS